MMKIDHEEAEKKGTFFIEENGEKLAELAYSRSAHGEMTINHTEVSPKLRGEGIGQDMVAAAVKFARENSLKIKATCPYAKKLIDTTPEYKDILA